MINYLIKKNQIQKESTKSKKDIRNQMYNLNLTEEHEEQCLSSAQPVSQVPA